MPIALGPAFETAVLTLAGIDPTTIDPGSLDITLLNPAGDTTVRCTLVLSVNTDAVKAAMKNALEA
ncbi:hypothetical protein ACFVU2_21135 [Leifsonia sp. NPDC058194]|uniref:hypothetical protein n=1 Tax=Leifsonia sp. NPDC058194 TaxID=3346374 RepID=UPI0036DCF74B